MVTCDRCNQECKRDGVGTGYAKFGDVTLCYECANKQEQADLKTATKYSGYFAGALTDGTIGKHVTTWTGGALVTITECHRIKHNMAGSGWAWSGHDADGQRWYGRAFYGPGGATTMRRAKA